MVTRLRIARLPTGDHVSLLPDAYTLSEHYSELQRLLRRHLAPTTASLFAEPAASADPSTIDWFSNLAGQPVALTQLSGPQLSEIRARLTHRLQSVAELADRLDEQSNSAAALLRSATQHPGDDFVYAIDGQPVLTFWGHRKPGAPAEQPRTIPRGGPIGDTTAARGTSLLDGNPADAEPPQPGRAWHWPLWLILAALLAAAALFLFDVLHWRWPPWGPDYAAMLAEARQEGGDLSTRLNELEKSLSGRMAICELRAKLRSAELEGQRLSGSIETLADRLADALALCSARGEVEDATETAAELEQEISRLEAQLAERIDACRKLSAEDAASVPARTETAARTETPLPPCPGERPPEEAPDVAVVLDASGSMEFPVTVDRGVLRDYRLKQAVGVFFGIPLPGSNGPNRLDAAKRGIKNVVGSLPEDVDIGLVVLADCPAAQKVGFFSHSQRGRLNRLTDSLRPMRKTPLASGVQQAAEMVDGVNAPGVIVVISDGEDTCRGDPCAVARAMKARKPKLTINVVDILGDGASNCLAQATGGKVLTPRQGMSFEKSIEQAAEEAQKPAHCR